MQNIMRLWLIGCCLGFHFRLTAAEDAPASTGATNNVAGGEQVFADPFAAENAPARPRLKISDPLEGVNRDFFRFNDNLYFWVLRPGARAYSKVAPKPVRSSVQRFFVNLRYPVRLVNNVLQGRVKPAVEETARFVVNSTLGIAGFFDPADEMTLKPQPADLDQTLGVYGIRPGCYLDWPILGPSSVRGSVGIAGDSLLTPGTYLDMEIIVPVRSYEVLNATSLHPGEYEDFKKAALDPYVALRSAYYDSREDFIRKARAARKSGGSR
jgi:phospholipid-binding lipoprotein MlaA